MYRMHSMGVRARTPTPTSTAVTRADDPTAYVIEHIRSEKKPAGAHDLHTYLRIRSTQCQIQPYTLLIKSVQINRRSARHASATDGCMGLRWHPNRRTIQAQALLQQHWAETENTRGYRIPGTKFTFGADARKYTAAVPQQLTCFQVPG